MQARRSPSVARARAGPLLTRVSRWRIDIALPSRIGDIEIVVDDAHTPSAAQQPTPLTRGYVRTGAAQPSLEQQCDALIAAGVAASRIYIDVVSDADEGPYRWPALSGLLSDACRGDSIVVGGLDRLGRNVAEMFETIRRLGERGLLLRSLHETIDLSTPTGLIVAGALSTLQRPQMRHGPEHASQPNDAEQARRQPIGRPRALDDGQAVLAHQLLAIGVSKTAIAKTLGVSRPTLYKALSGE